MRNPNRTPILDPIAPQRGDRTHLRQSVRHDGCDWKTCVRSPWDSLYAYDPYGERFTATGAFTEVIWCQIKPKGPTATPGLHYYGLRYYNPVTGGWLNRDPIQERGGIDLYAFVRNQPINLIDYLGREKAKPMGTWGELIPEQTDKLDTLIPPVPIPSSENLLPKPEIFGTDASSESGTAINAIAAAPQQIFDNIFPSIQSAIKDDLFNKGFDKCGAHSRSSCSCCVVSIWPDSHDQWTINGGSSAFLYNMSCSKAMVLESRPALRNAGTQVKFIPW